MIVMKMEKKILLQIHALEQEIAKLTDEELRNKKVYLKRKLLEGAKEEEILPESFAVVKEAVKRVTGKILYDVQLIGGAYVAQDYIAEIKAGEGKTLVQSLPSYLHALHGKGVHVITTNEYLAKRDYTEIGKILEFLGVTVGFIYQGMERKERKEAYQKEVTYGTNTEFGFDFLRDNIASSKEELVQRPLYDAILDEADSILIDEAQTPMIISKKNSILQKYPYQKAQDFVASLTGTGIVKEEPKNKKQWEMLEQYDYYIEETYKTVALTQKGIAKAEREYGVQNLYEPQNKEILHYIMQALRANYILKKEEDYIVKEDTIILIDSFTGRRMEGKKYTNGLHEAVQTKEHVKLEEASQMLASITTQKYFQMYTRISGMTGTAKTSQKELEEIYGLDVKQVPRNKPSQRIDKPDKLFYTLEEKYNAIIEDIKQTHKTGRPILVGTTSIEKSEVISKLLQKENLPHQVLNAKNHEKEAAIVAGAGKKGAITIATNMAGRGTNILLGGTEISKKEDVVRVRWFKSNWYRKA